jgi:hypothetical protein
MRMFASFGVLPGCNPKTDLELVVHHPQVREDALQHAIVGKLADDFVCEIDFRSARSSSTLVCWFMSPLLCGLASVVDAREPEMVKRIAASLTGSASRLRSISWGNDDTLALALGSTRTGGKVTQIGLAGGTTRMRVLANVGFEVTFEATLWSTLKELHEVVALAEGGKLRLAPVELAPLEPHQRRV